MNLEMAWPWALLALPLPLLVAWLAPRAPQGFGNTLRVPFFEVLGSGAVARDNARRWPLLLLAALCWTALVVAATRPQLTGDPIQLPVVGRDIMMAVDLSGSMEMDDMVIAGQRVDRLTAVKAVAGEFIEGRHGDRLGLILFGQQAYLQTPLTFDRTTVRTLLDEAAIGLAGKETAIGDAIGLAVKRLRQQPEENRVLVLLTDGANTAGTVDPLKAADLAAQEGIRIYTIGVGSDAAARGGFAARALAGAEIDERTLLTIAEQTGGRYFRAHDTRSLLAIYELLDALEPVSEAQELYRPVREIYWWPLGISLVLSVVVALLVAGLPSSVREIAHVR